MSPTCETIQISNVLPCGEYADVRVYDDGGKTIDRYTVVFMDTAHGKPRMFDCVAMGSDVISPQGFYQHSECMLGRHLGRQIKFSELPTAHQRRIILELREMNKAAQ